MFLTELVMNKFRLCHINKIVRVIGFHFGGKATAFTVRRYISCTVCRHTCRGMYIFACSKMLQIKFKHIFSLPFFNIKSALKFNPLSPCSSFCKVRTVFLRKLVYIVLHNNSALIAQTILARSRRAGLYIF